MTDDLAQAKRREDLIDQAIEAACDASSAMPPGKRGWNERDYALAEAAARKMFELTDLDAEGQTVEGGASRPVVVTDEMALQGAWGPINEFAQRLGIEPFDPRMAPDINEIARVRLILSAALNGGI